MNTLYSRIDIILRWYTLYDSQKIRPKTHRPWCMFQNNSHLKLKVKYLVKCQGKSVWKILSKKEKFKKITGSGIIVKNQNYRRHKNLDFSECGYDLNCGKQM